MAIQKRYYLTRDNAHSLMDAVIEEVYSKSVTKFRLELTAAVDELPMVHVEYDAHAHDFAVNDYLQKMGFNDDDDDINENGTSAENTD